jgi:hypothetical protein
MPTQAKSRAPAKRAAPKAKSGAAPRRKKAAAPRKSSATALKDVAPKARRATQKRLDKMGDGVDQLGKIIDRLSAQVKELGTHVAEARESLTKPKKKKGSKAGTRK